MSALFVSPKPALRLFLSLLVSGLISLPLIAFSAESNADAAAEEKRATSETETAKTGDVDGPLTAEEILTFDPSQADYSEEIRCINTGQIRQVEVIDEKHVSFSMSRDRYYLVRFKHRCPGLRRHKPVIYETTSSQRLCAHDAIRGTFDTGVGNITPGARCSINGFETVSKEQIVMLKEAIDAERRAKRKKRT